jgi:hypothetical protein
MHATNNTLSQNGRDESLELLNKHLVVTSDLHAQAKRHRRVRGPEK